MWARVHKRIQINICLYCVRVCFGYGGDGLPRITNIIKRVGETCTIVMCYTPIVLYVYSYVLYDSIRYRTDNNMTEWLTHCLHVSIDSYLTFAIVQFQTAIWGTPLPPTPECMSPYLTYTWHGGIARFRYRWNFLRYTAFEKIPQNIFEIKT